MATGVRVSFESVGLNAEEYQRFIDAGGIDWSTSPVPKRLVLCVVAPTEDALLHALYVEHAFGKALAHELLGNVLVVAIKIRHLAGIDELDGIEVLFGLGGEHLKERLLVGLHLKLHKVRA